MHTGHAKIELDLPGHSEQMEGSYKSLIDVFVEDDDDDADDDVFHQAIWMLLHCYDALDS